MVLGKLRESGSEDVRAEPRGCRHRALVVHGADGAHGRRAGKGVPAVGHASRVRAAGECLVDRVADQHPAERHIPGVHAFREDQEVRGNPVVVDAEPRSGAAEADEHLVGDEDDAMTGAQVPDPAQIAGRRHDDPRAAGHRFQDQRGDSRRALQKDHLLEMRERPLALLLGRARPEHRAVQERAEEVDGSPPPRCPKPSGAGHR